MILRNYISAIGGVALALAVAQPAKAQIDCSNCLSSGGTQPDGSVASISMDENRWKQLKLAFGKRSDHSLPVTVQGKPGTVSGADYYMAANSLMQKMLAAAKTMPGLPVVGSFQFTDGETIPCRAYGWRPGGSFEAVCK